MAKILAICVLLALTASCCLAAKARPDCTVAGQVRCSDNCSDVVLCMGDGAGGLREEVVESCDPEPEEGVTPTHCYLPTESCSDRYSSCDPTPAFEFQCTGVGLFPDPFSCFAYYLCTETGLPGTWYPCTPEDKGFNSTRGFCNLAADSRACVENPIPECTSVGQAEATIENPNLYYICKRINNELLPILYQCSGGGVFNDVTKECEAEKKRSVG